MLNKRAQGLPLNTIIIAIIVVTVLVVLIVIFTGQTRRWVGGIGDCEAQGGSCMTGSSCPEGLSKAPLAECKDKTEVCCIKLGEIKKKSCEDVGGKYRGPIADKDVCEAMPFYGEVIGDSNEYAVPEGKVCCEWS